MPIVIKYILIPFFLFAFLECNSQIVKFLEEDVVATHAILVSKLNKELDQSYSWLPIEFVSVDFVESSPTKKISGLVELIMIDAFINIKISNDFKKEQVILTLPVKATFNHTNLDSKNLLNKIKENDWEKEILINQSRLEDILKTDCHQIEEHLRLTSLTSSIHDYNQMIKKIIKLNDNCRAELIGAYSRYLEKNRDNICNVVKKDVELLILENRIEEAIDQIRNGSYSNLCATESIDLINRIQTKKKENKKLQEMKQKISKFESQPIQSISNSIFKWIFPQ